MDSETVAVFSPVALPAAILNELLHPGPSRQHGTLGSTLRNNSLLCRVYILKRLEMSPGDLSWEEVKIERLLGKAKVIFINDLKAEMLTDMQRAVTRVLPTERLCDKGISEYVWAEQKLLGESKLSGRWLVVNFNIFTLMVEDAPYRCASVQI